MLKHILATMKEKMLPAASQIEGVIKDERG